MHFEIPICKVWSKKHSLNRLHKNSLIVPEHESVETYLKGIRYLVLNIDLEGRLVLREDRVLSERERIPSLEWL